MNREEALNHPHCPQWLKDAQWEGDVDISSSGYVTWKRGIWEDGTWKGGTWEYGTWERGTWERGTWERGIWKRGTWKGGTWKGGIWEDGRWEDGTWEDGFKTIGHCYWNVHYSKDCARIGCKRKTYDEWDEWFAGDEVYEHARDTERFKKIHQVYLMAKAARDIEYGGNNG